MRHAVGKPECVGYGYLQFAFGRRGGVIDLHIRAGGAGRGGEREREQDDQGEAGYGAVNHVSISVEVGEPQRERQLYLQFVAINCSAADRSSPASPDTSAGAGRRTRRTGFPARCPIRVFRSRSSL